MRPLLSIADLIINFNSNLFVRIHNTRHLSSIAEVTVDNRNSNEIIPRKDISADEFIAQNEGLFTAFSAMVAVYAKDKSYEYSSE